MEEKVTPNQKYELIDAPKHIQCLGHKYQIRALKSFNNVNEGDLGGYVNNELVLSQEGDCWIYPNAYVDDNVRISEDSVVLPESIIMGNVKINGISRIRARIYCSGLLELERCDIGFMLYPTEFKCDCSRIKNSTILVSNFNLNALPNFEMENAYICSPDDIFVFGNTVSIQSRNRLGGFAYKRYNDDISYIIEDRGGRKIFNSTLDFISFIKEFKGAEVSDRNVNFIKNFVSSVSSWFGRNDIRKVYKELCEME